jgi:hypothetical protein
MDEMGYFMVLNLTEKQARAIQEIHDSWTIGEFIFTLFDETKFKHLKEKNRYWKNDCLSIYHKFEIPEKDDTVTFQILNYEGGFSDVYVGTISQYEVIKYISYTRFCSVTDWRVDLYEPPTMVDIR